MFKKMKNINKMVVLFFFVFILIGCGEEEPITLGIVSDIEGAIENAQRAAAQLRDADLVIIAGDVYENEQLRVESLYPESKDNKKEMIEGITPFAELGIPIYVIPGNHEEQEVYFSGIAALQERYPLVFDLYDADLEGVNLVALRGYHDEQFITKEGFTLEEKEYQETQEKITFFQKQNEPLIFVTHGPPLSETDQDWVEGVGHVGDAKITKMLEETKNKNMLHVHGHLHEHSGKESIFPVGTSLNIASITSYNNKDAPSVTKMIIKKGEIQIQK